jgi:retinol dehydrogenase 12
MRPLQWHPIYGAYTELYAGLSPDLVPEDSGAWLIPWGRVGSLRGDIALAGKSRPNRGQGLCEDFWEWSTEQVREFI